MITSCSRSLPRILGIEGSQYDALHVVTRTTTMVRLFYAASVWWGLTSAKTLIKLERFHMRVQRMGFLKGNASTVVALVSSAEDALLRFNFSNSNHVLSGLMPATATRNYNLRPRPHNVVLQGTDDRNYVSRALHEST